MNWRVVCWHLHDLERNNTTVSLIYWLSVGNHIKIQCCRPGRGKCTIVSSLFNEDIFQETKLWRKTRSQVIINHWLPTQNRVRTNSPDISTQSQNGRYYKDMTSPARYCLADFLYKWYQGCCNLRMRCHLWTMISGDPYSKSNVDRDHSRQKVSQS